MYIDIDTIAMSSEISAWFDMLHNYTLVNGDWSPENDTITLGVIGS
jgi:hypothetical protein